MEPVIYRNRFFRAGLFPLVLAVLAAGQQLAAEEPPLKIEKIYFMFHPVCWRMQGPKIPQDWVQMGYTQQWWTDCCQWELEVNQRQKDFMTRMKPNEALVLFPINTSPLILELQEHAAKTLGRRCIIASQPDAGLAVASARWAKLPDPVERFLNDPNLEGKAECLKQVPPDIQKELETEMREAWQTRTGDWSLGVVRVVYTSRLSAKDILEKFKTHNLYYDPATVESEAFGEGFEQCAMTWKQMLTPYLGLTHAPANIFELSVSCASFLFNTKRHERIKLSDDVCLYLWEAADGRKIALLARSSCRLKDPQLFARVPIEGMSAEVRDESEKKHWPKADPQQPALAAEEGCLKLPVLSGSRRDAFSGAFYLIAEGIPMDQFRKRLVEAKISP